MERRATTLPPTVTETSTMTSSLLGSVPPTMGGAPIHGAGVV